ncbi:MAG: hypothetical protein JWP91_828 [Fibrobacteres bacterium]|nr:hypothetical protein [Fibrobacterota bacterium]
MRTKNGFALLGCLSALAATGCFDSGSSSQGPGSKGGRIHLLPSISGGKAGSAKVGSSGTGGLESFQVPVADIQLAKGLTTSGSGWSGITGSLPLFRQQMGDWNSIDSTVVRDPAWASHFIDFCDPASVARIASSQPFTLRDTGEYHWAVINWAPYFKVRATIPLPGGDTVYTHDGPITTHIYPNSSNPYFVTEAARPMLTGPSEDAFVRKNNGGTWFRFLKPLRLTEADLDSGTTIADTVGRDSLGHPIVNQIPSGTWNVMLVFNPRDLVYAGNRDSGNMSLNGDIQTPDSSTYVHVPFLKATAVPYREGEDVMRETYEFTVHFEEPWAHGDFGMRLELYLIGDNLVATTVHTYPTDGNLAPQDAPAVYFAEEKEDGSLSLQNYDHSPIFDGFVRKTTVGQEGSVAYNPGAQGGTAHTLTYRLTEIKKAN